MNRNEKDCSINGAEKKQKKRKKFSNGQSRTLIKLCVFAVMQSKVSYITSFHHFTPKNKNSKP